MRVVRGAVVMGKGQKMDKLTLFESREHEKGLLEGFIRGLSPVGGELRILEAGCGQYWPLDLDGVPYRLTGVDLDTAALEIRKRELNDLDEVIVADLRTVGLEPGAWDVVYNSFVLEHIEGAEPVLDRFFQWLRPGGLLILRIPDRDTVYGFMTRLTPHWVHVAFKKYVVRMPHAGEPGHGPYPTYHEPVISRRGVRGYCGGRGLKILGEWGHPFYLQGRGLRFVLMRLFVRVVNAISLGSLPWRYSNLTFVIENAGGVDRTTRSKV